jgi:ABC-type transport system involved in multi-copper enzyme maturation permease subunit
MAAAVLGVVFITAEYSRGMIRTTFALTPRRGRVLLAKAVIVAGVTFLCGLVASVAAFLLGQPLLRENGYRPPAYPYFHLADGPVLRAVIGTAAFLALLALLGLGLGTIMRRAAGAITLIIVPTLVPLILASLLPLTPGIWIQRLTPSAGFAIQETRERFDSAISPWGGLAVLAGYAAVALTVALWQLRRRDV